MKEIRVDQNGNIHGLPQKDNKGHETYKKRQKIALQKAGKFATVNTEKIYNAIGGRPSDVDDLEENLPFLSRIIYDSRIKPKDFECHIERILRSSIGQGGSELPGLMAQTLKDSVWREIGQIRLERQTRE